MRFVGLVKVDSKGRITIPQAIRGALDIDTGMYLVLIADLKKREIVISPVTGATKMYQVDIELLDKPGALAKLTSKLAELGADIITSKCTSIARGETGECTIIVDLDRAKVDAEKLKEELEKLDVVTVVKIRPFEQTA